MDSLALQQLIEAVLFYKGEPMKKTALAKICGVSEKECTEALLQLMLGLEGRGIVMIEHEDTVALGTAPNTKEVIETMRREELEGPLGKAGLETLAVVMYQGPVSRADIEYVRGVNCSSILRSLTMRGLIEKKENPRDKRGYVYQTTPELPAALGLTSLAALPEFEPMRAKIEEVLAAQKEEAATAP